MLRHPVTVQQDGGDVCFALELGHLHPDRRLDTEAVSRDGVALITTLEGQRDARFVLQTLSEPDPHRREHGRLSIHLVVALTPTGADPTARVEEVCDDLLDLLSAPPVRWGFSPVTDETTLQGILNPLQPDHLAEIARREEPCLPTAWEGGVGFGAEPGDRVAERQLWSMWTLGPPSHDLRRLGSVLLAQEAPVCVRVSLTPSAVTTDERSAIEQLALDVAGTLPGEGLLRASLHTIESLLYLRPVFDVRCIVASPDPLSRSMLSALGHAISDPPAHGSPQPVLRGGSAVLNAGTEVDRAILLDAYQGLSGGRPVPSLAPPGLERLRRLLGPWEAANVFRIPTTDDEGFPGLDTLHVPDLDVPAAELPTAGRTAGHLVGDARHQVFLDPEERFRHLYVSGQTGTGKSTLLENLALQDIAAGAGVAVLDPHGDLVEALLAHIPEHRLDDVVLVDPADPVSVVGVNLLEAETPTQREYVVSELAAMFYALFDPRNLGIVGPRFESWARQAALLLLANPDQPSSFLDIATLFTDPPVRRHLIEAVEDPILAEFWLGEMAQTSDFHRSEVIGWFRSKFEVFRTSSLVRHVVGQASSTVSFSEVLNDQKILLVNLAKGLLGDYNSSLIGHIVFSRLWSAALERASVPVEERPDFHLYLDEFQNITSESLPALLSEARKFRVGVTLANQFFSQVPEMMRDSIMGNVASRVTFRLGPKDAQPFASWLGPRVDPGDLTGLPNHVAIAALSRDGIPLDPFPFRTEPPPEVDDDKRAERARERSRQQWAVPVDDIDAEFFSRWAHVKGSASHKLFADQSGRTGRASKLGSALPDHSFVARWVIERHRARWVDGTANLAFKERPAAMVPCIAVLRARLGGDASEMLRVAGAKPGAVLADLPWPVANALRYELGLVGAQVTIEAASGEDRSPTPTGEPPRSRDRPLDALELPEHASEALGLLGCTTLGELADQTPDNLGNVGIDEATLVELSDQLASYGLALSGIHDFDGSSFTNELIDAMRLGGLAANDRLALLVAAGAELDDRFSQRIKSTLAREDFDLVINAQEAGVGGFAMLEELLPDHVDLFSEVLGEVSNEIFEARNEILIELSET